jgi:protein-S-isoprenylcysteine O-methyltransferase Ste14
MEVGAMTQPAGEAIFRLITLLLLVAFILHRGYYTRKAERRGDEVKQEIPKEAQSRVAPILSMLALIATALYIAIPALVSFASLPLPLWMRWFGVLVALCGFGLLQWSQETLGNNWSDTPRLLEQQQLVTTGPYHWIRHPIYTAFLLILGSLLFITSNWLIGGLWLAAISIDIAARVRYEEALLATTFGDAYRSWASHTGAILPRFA